MSKSALQLLQQVYKFDINGLLSALSLDNFSNYFHLLRDIFKSRDIDALIKQKFSEKITIFCFNRIFTSQSDDDTLILQLIRLSLPFVSNDSIVLLLKVFTFHFIKFLQTRDELRSSINVPKFMMKDIEHSRDLFNEFTFDYSILSKLFDILIQGDRFNEVFSSGDTSECVEFLVDISLNTLNETSDSTLVKTLISIIEKFGKMNEKLKENILSRCLGSVKNAYDRVSDDYSSTKKRLECFIEDSTIFLIASLADLYIDESMHNTCHLINQHQFWYLIHYGLNHTNSLTRKRSLYLIKRIVDYCQVGKIQFTCKDHDGRTILFDSNALTWNDYFLCIELFDESSVHIIKPCLPKAQKLLNHVLQGDFHFIWLLSLIYRGFHHESKFMVRWSISFLCQSKIERLITIENIQIFNRFMFGPFLIAIQNAFIYYKCENFDFTNKCPQVSIYLSEFINRYVLALPSAQEQINFIEKFTFNIQNSSWNGTCLFFILKAINDIDLQLSQVFKHLETIKNLNKIAKNLVTQEILLRGASQCYIINIITKHLNALEVGDDLLREIFTIIHSISTQESLSYLNSTWNQLVRWFNETVKKDPKQIALFLNNEFNSFNDSNEIDEFSLINTSLKLGKIVLLLSDANDSSVTEYIFLVITDRLQSANRYLYMQSQKIDKCLFLFGAMIGLINSSCFVDKSKQSFLTIKRIYNLILGDAIDYLFRKIDDEKSSICMLELYSKTLGEFIGFSNELHDNNKIIMRKKLVQEQFVSLLVKITANDSQEQSPPCKSFASLNYLSILCNSALSPALADVLLVSKQHQECVLRLLNYKIPSKQQLISFKKDLPQALLNNIISNYSLFNGKSLEILWLVYNFLLHHKRVLPTDSKVLLLSKYNEALDLASPQCLTSITKALKNFQHDNDSLDRYVESLENTLCCIWEIYSDVKNFTTAYATFVDCLFSHETFNEKIMCKKLFDFMLKFIKEITLVGKEKNGIVKPVLDKLLVSLARTTSSVNEIFIEVLLDFIIFGDVYRKERRHNKDIEVYIESQGELLGVNQLIQSEYQHDLGVRICSLNYLLASNHLDISFYQKIIDQIIKKDQEFSEGRQKLYINSLVHREKFRLWQAVLILLTKLSDTQCKRIFDCGDQNLITENQPSTRTLIEWVLIKILLLRKYDVCYLLKKSDEFSTKKVGYCCSWMSILSHLLPYVDANLKVNYFKDLVSILLSRILSSNFHIRTYAEASLIKLYMLYKNKHLNEDFLANFEVTSMCSFIYSIVKTSLEDQERHAYLLINHFYFQFDPLNDYCIDTIFHTFPRLSGIIEDEFVDAQIYTCLVLEKRPHELNEDDFKKISKLVPLRNPHTKLEKCTIGVWKFNAYKEEHATESASSVEDLQKKITPWHSVIPRQDDLETLITNRKLGCEEENEQGGLIVVASLIDKGSNLGGLCRTCEIFNVKEFVIGNLHYTQDKQFQSLSVTADKWLNIKEVQLKALKQFLIEMKYYGYRLIGLEQTTNSVKLHEYEFPKKALILLGNEKEGIPVELIQLLDLCIEIPQLGIVRSLNVHVSASLAIWEYSKQHFISK